MVKDKLFSGESNPCIRIVDRTAENAASHPVRSYLDPGNIQVAIYDDRLEVTSPGMLLNSVSIAKMKEGYSKIRNRAIAYAFSYMKIIEKWGSGIPRMIRECREYGLKEPEFIDFDGDFRVNMYRSISSDGNTVVKDGTTQAPTQGTTRATQGTTQATQGTTQATHEKLSLTEAEKSVLTLIDGQPTISQTEIAVQLGWKVDRAKYYLKKLRQNRMIERVGSSQKGHWKLLIENATWQN